MNAESHSSNRAIIVGMPFSAKDFPNPGLSIFHTARTDGGLRHGTVSVIEIRFDVVLHIHRADITQCNDGVLL